MKWSPCNPHHYFRQLVGRAGHEKPGLFGVSLKTAWALREVSTVLLSFQCAWRLLSSSYPSFSRRRMSHWLCSSSVPPAHQQGKSKSPASPTLWGSFLQCRLPSILVHTPSSPPHPLSCSLRLTSTFPTLNYISSVSLLISLPSFLFWGFWPPVPVLSSSFKCVSPLS